MKDSFTIVSPGYQLIYVCFSQNFKRHCYQRELTYKTINENFIFPCRLSIKEKNDIMTGPVMSTGNNP